MTSLIYTPSTTSQFFKEKRLICRNPDSQTEASTAQTDTNKNKTEKVAKRPINEKEADRQSDSLVKLAEQAGGKIGKTWDAVESSAKKLLTSRYVKNRKKYLRKGKGETYEVNIGERGSETSKKIGLTALFGKDTNILLINVNKDNYCYAQRIGNRYINPLDNKPVHIYTGDTITVPPTDYHVTGMKNAVSMDKADQRRARGRMAKVKKPPQEPKKPKKVVKAPTIKNKPAETVATISQTEAIKLYESGVSLLNDHNNSGRIFSIYTKLQGSPIEHIRARSISLLYQLSALKEDKGYYKNAASYYNRLFVDFRGKPNPKTRISMKNCKIKASQCDFLNKMQAMLGKNPGTIIDPHNIQQVAKALKVSAKYGSRNLLKQLQKYLNSFYKHPKRDVIEKLTTKTTIQERVDRLKTQKNNTKLTDCYLFTDIAKGALGDSIKTFRYVTSGKTLEGSHTHIMAFAELNNGEKLAINNNRIIRLGKGKYSDKQIIAALSKTLPSVERRPRYAKPYMKIYEHGERPGMVDDGTIYHASAGVAKIAQRA